MIYSVYTVPPFSGQRYAENAERCEDHQTPCGICGRPVPTEGHEYWGIVIDGGAAWGTSQSPLDSGHMGAFPIGRECHRKYKKPEA